MITGRTIERKTKDALVTDEAPDPRGRPRHPDRERVAVLLRRRAAAGTTAEAAATQRRGPVARSACAAAGCCQDSNLVQHEEYHGEQGAATCMAFLPVDAVLLAHGHWIWSLVLGSLTHAAFHYGANGIAWLRGEAMYEGASTEEGANAVAAADDHDH